MEQKLVLIDGHSILNRAFYGVPDLTNPEGLHTNAIYGFLNIMFKILEEEKPQYLAVAFDLKAPTFRHKRYAAYKGTRKPMPEELRQQVPVMKEVLAAMGILTMEQEGYEADDILGTMAKRAEKEGIAVALVSGDRDLLQIATDTIKIRIPKTKGNRTEVEDYYAADVKERYHVSPLQFIELKALMGDTADNIPGVPKVGEKTATGLMETYGSIENIYAHLDEITKKSIQTTLRENRELADLSKELATIETDAPISYTLAQAKLGDMYTKEAYELFKRLAFKNMLSRFENAGEAEKPLPECRLVSNMTEAERVFNECASAEIVAYYVARDTGIALTFSEDNSYFVAAQGFLTMDYLAGKLDGLRRSCMLVSFDCKKSYDCFSGDVEMVSGFFDVKLAAYLMNPLKSEYTIDDVAGEYCGIALQDYKTQFGKVGYADAFEADEGKFTAYMGSIVYTIKNSYPLLTAKLQESGMEELFWTMEMPLTYVLYAMEKEGVIVKKDELVEYGRLLEEKIVVLRQQIYDAVGEVFNINSPKQLGEILFEKMQLKGGKKTKTGYSTAADVLEKLAPEYPVVADILEYRGLTKLKSTYADGLAEYIGEDGRIHTSFNQMITATGRISSTEPNLQNIPMRMELGRLIRKVFVPKEGCVFMDADYSQIELRILAHMSEDEELIEAYRMSEDIHRITASKVFHTPFEEVTDLQRRNAKAVNFGIVYGISSFGLSQDLSISRKEAAAYIDQYFETYPGIKQFLDRCVQTAKETGESRTLYERRRPIPELGSSNFMQRQFGERVAMNAPIQGTAADIMKIAMIRVYRSLLEEGLKSRILLQVHDELLLEVYEDEVEQVREILYRDMKGAAQLSVELEIDVHTGENWYEAK
ncbi:MAG: DNA polymerase I [Lachnospiraceae bacterium]|nr:DNA polymerase I [Lachnospiraceae bacterium]